MRTLTSLGRGRSPLLAARITRAARRKFSASCASVLAFGVSETMAGVVDSRAGAAVGAVVAVAEDDCGREWPASADEALTASLLVPASAEAGRGLTVPPPLASATTGVAAAIGSATAAVVGVDLGASSTVAVSAVDAAALARAGSGFAEGSISLTFGMLSGFSTASGVAVVSSAAAAADEFAGVGALTAAGGGGGGRGGCAWQMRW